MPRNLQTQELPTVLTPLADYNPYWVYSQRWLGGRNGTEGRIFQVAVVTSPHINSAFNRSYLRLIIVNDANGLSITDSNDSLEGEDPETEREAKVDIRLIQMHRDRSNDVINARCTPTEECFTLALALTRTNAYDGTTYAELRPLPLAQRRLRILYNRVHSLDSFGRLALLTLECTTRVFTDPTCMFVDDPGASIHFFHISPINLTANSERALANSLPKSIINRIGIEAIQPLSYGYRRQIFYLGTLARSWTPILDLYFLLHADFDFFQQEKVRLDGEASIISVARSLELRPEKAQLMRGFSLCFYREHEQWRRLSERKQSDALKAANRILQLLADSKIERIEIYPVPQPLYHDYLCALSELGHVRFITEWEWPLHHDGMSNFPYISIRDLQVLIEKWPGVRRLTVRVGKEHPSIWSRDEDRLLACNPSQLTIRSSGFEGDFLSGSNFRRFFETPAPRIQELALVFVVGPSNRDLYQALFQTRGTLHFLRIFCSTFTRSNDDEEYALDQLMHELTHIKKVDIYKSNCIGSKSIAKKQPDIDDQKSTLSIYGAEPAMAVGIVEALNEGGWRRVSIEQEQSENFFEDSEEATQIALERGIQFSWYASM